MRKSAWPLLALLVLLPGLVAGCSSAPAQEHSYSMASLDQMPAEVQAAPVTVRQAYQFAAANPEVLQQIPCYCGCGAMGHTSNYSCYVAGAGADGTPTYDPHALGCSICVDITLDTMRLLAEGRGVQDIRAYIDATYSKYGPSNMP